MGKKPSAFGRILEWIGGICFAAGFLFQYITFAHILLLGYLLAFRGLGLFLAFSQAFERDAEAETAAINHAPEGARKIRWPDILCPFLDTDMPGERGRALSRLRAGGLSDGKIRLVRGLVGIGFVILVADEWLEFNFADVKARWTLTLLIDAVVAGGIYFLSVNLGVVLAGLWMTEAAIFLGILGFDRFVVRG